MVMKKIIACILCCCIVFSIEAQLFTPDVYPSHWWAGMKWNKVQLMLQSKGINTAGGIRASTSFPGVKVLSTVKADHPDYLFINIEISPAAKPGNVDFTLT